MVFICLPTIKVSDHFFKDNRKTIIGSAHNTKEIFNKNSRM